MDGFGYFFFTRNHIVLKHFFTFNLNKWFSHRSIFLLHVLLSHDFVVSKRRCFFPHLSATLLDFPFYCGVCLVQTDISTSINYKFNQWLGCQHCNSVGMNSTLTLILSNYLQPFFMFYAINLYVVSLFEDPFFMFFSLRIHYVLYQFNWMNIISFSKKKTCI